ncbi:MAG: cysteine synthase family protein [Candidatus Pacebacteria bacterium]|nr:cysteine synthase family protein [Candidatus Paceibacterota bacterium]
MARTILDNIGNTPLVKVESADNDDSANIFAKIEGMNPGGSIKDRIALNMILDAEEKGLLKEGDTIIEPTSGNTGVALAMVAAMTGYKAQLIMPNTTSPEKMKIIKAFGGEVVLIEKNEWGEVKKVIEKIKDRIKNGEKLVLLNQYENKNNPGAHYIQTAEEIIAQMEDLPDPNFFVAGMGTGGTITGVGLRLKEKFPNIKIIGVQPVSGDTIEGLRSLEDFIPPVVNLDLINKIYDLEAKKALEAKDELAKTKGILAGPSSGAAFFISKQLAAENPGATIVTIFPDRGERYL